MSTPRMHADELEIDVALVQKLLAGQFPRWAHLSVRPHPSAGTDNALFRLGDELAVRLPRIRKAASQMEKDQRWLSRLAPHLPLEIPVPIAQGAPTESYPCVWGIYRWLEGSDALSSPVHDLHDAAHQLADFIHALHAIDTNNSEGDAPVPGAQNFGRGVPLAERDTATRAAIAQVSDLYDTTALTTEWEAALAAPIWNKPPVWIHGDLAPGNFLVRHGRLSAIIDFGALGVGDPACDLLPAWNYFDTASRRHFRDRLQVDDATWQRGRGWALSVALIAIPYYINTNPVLVATSRRVIDQLLDTK